LIFAALLAAAALALVLQLSRSGLPQRLWLPNLVAFAGVLLLVVPGLAPLMERERQQPVREVAALAGQWILPGEPLLVVGYKRYSVVFYSGHPARFFDSAAGAEEQLRAEAQQGAPRPPSLLVVGEERKLREFSLPPERIERLASRGSQALWRLRFPPQQGGESRP
jgi:4-amino-4-deoxy-L-arabinose transferase-like glycosyltransferase